MTCHNLIGEGEANQPRLRYGAETNRPTYKCPSAVGLHIGCCGTCGAAAIPFKVDGGDVPAVFDYICVNENCPGKDVP